MTVAIVCGSRHWTDPDPVHTFVSKLPEGSVVVHGAQRGADTVADRVARELGYEVAPVEAEWEALGDAAGPERNSRMLAMLLIARQTFRQPVLCAAFHEEPGLGRGTRDMVIKCVRAKVRTSVWAPDDGWYRASHLLVCKECGREYIDHPALTSVTDQDGVPFLHWVCDGGHGDGHGDGHGRGCAVKL